MNIVLALIFLFLMSIEGNKAIFISYGILIVFFRRFKNIPIRIKKFQIYIILYLILGLVLNMIIDPSIQRGFLNILYYIPAISYSTVVFNIIEKYTPKNIFNLVTNFVYINISIIIVQYLGIVIKFRTINPFKISMAAGDNFRSIYSSSLILFIVLSMITFFYFEMLKYKEYRSKSKKIILVCWIIMIATSTLTHTIIYFSILCINYCVNLIIKGEIIKFIKMLIITVGLVTVFSVIQPENVTYIVNQINSSINGPIYEKPRKLQFMYTTLFDFTKDVEWVPIIGVGGGNYSSRAAINTSGEFYEKAPKFIYINESKYTNNYVVRYWNSYILSQKYQDGFANYPTSEVMTILGETGILGIVIIIIALLNLLKLNKSKWSFWLNIYFICLLFLDNYLQFPAIISIFFLNLYGINLIENEINGGD